jgi:hypothetical protein
MVDEKGRISRGNNFDTLDLLKLDILDKIEGCFIGQITNINKEDNMVYVKKHYKNKNNDKIINDIIVPCLATNLFCFNFPYNINDIVVVLHTKIQANSFLLNNVPYIHNVYNVNDLHEEINNIIIFNLTKADLTNTDTITIPFGDITITIKQDGSYALKNSKITINFDKEGNIKLDNQKGQIQIDNQGQITIKNNQAMLNIDQTGLFSIQNIEQAMSLLTILNTDLVNVLTNLTPSSSAFAQALAQYKQDISKLLK